MHEGLLEDLEADGFGHWLAGFIDGEGCFGIPPNNANGYMCRFSIGLRVDDRPVLEAIHRRLRIGGIYDRPLTARATAMRAGTQPGVSWVVTDQRGCALLVQLLDRFPLRAKKAKDYAIWREAVITLGAMPRRNVHRPRDWTRMKTLKDRLRRSRDEGLLTTRAAPVEMPETPVQEVLPVG